MLLKRLFIALYAGLLLYTILMVGFGPSGFEVQAAERARIAAMEARMEELRGLNQRLKERIVSLKRSEEAVAVQAKSLGYFSEGEGVIVLPRRSSAFSREGAGEVLVAGEYVGGAGTQTCAMLASLFSLAAFVALSLGSSRTAAAGRKAPGLRKA